MTISRYHSDIVRSADMMRTRTLCPGAVGAIVMKLNEDVVKSLPVPVTGNKVHYFADAVLQGTKAPRGFGVRVTAGGVRSFVLNYRVAHRERRYTIGVYPDWSVLNAVTEARTLRQRIDRGARSDTSVE